jgi:four helix bundle protein
MAGFKRFEEIEAWQQARKLSLGLHRTIEETALAKNFVLRDQISRAAVSVAANIAEGFARNSNADFARFLDLSRGSCAELQSHLYLAYDLRLLEKEKFAALYQQVERTSALIGGLILSLRNNRPQRTR